MASCIHHGPPGSYKSYSIIQRYIIAALAEGRTVISNIRGLNDINRIIELFPEIEFSERAQLFFVDTSKQDGRDFLARWWHWVPFGAMVVIDEAQRIYPDRRDFKLESLDKFNFDVSVDTLPESRPHDVHTAFDMQRHFNWDLFLTSTNIAKIKPEIREVCEWAYRHRDVSNLLPWFRNTWYEHQHDPESNGKALSHVVGAPTRYKADARVFECYQSTATGEHTESKAGRRLFQDGRILAQFVGIGLVVLFGTVLLVSKFSGDEKPSIAGPVRPAPAQDVFKHAAADRLPNPEHVVHRTANHVFAGQFVAVIEHRYPGDAYLVRRDESGALQVVTFSEVAGSGRVSSSIITGLCSVMIDKQLVPCSESFVRQYCTGYAKTPDVYRAVGCRFDSESEPRGGGGADDDKRRTLAAVAIN